MTKQRDRNEVLRLATPRYKKSHYLLEKVCIQCLNFYQCYKYNMDQKYCSRKCASDAIKEKNKEISKTYCGYCKSEIFRKPSRISKYKMQFCNRICQQKHYSESMKGENNPNFGHTWSDELKSHLSKIKDQGKKKHCVCSVCGKKFTTYYEGIYCSRKCGGTEKINLDVKEFKELYDHGYHDAHIGVLLNVSETKIRRFRRKMGLPSKWSIGITLMEKKNYEKYGVAFRWEEVNSLKFHPTENLKSNLVKYCMSLLLKKNHKNFLVEALTSKGIIDVYNLTDRIIYEFETGLNDSKKKEKYEQLFDSDKMNDFFIFKTEDFPDDPNEILKDLAIKTGLKFKW